MSARHRLSPELAFIASCPQCGCRQRIPAHEVTRHQLYGCAGCRVAFALQRSQVRAWQRAAELARRTV